MTATPILVVDDATANLKLMRLLLTHEGYEVRTAERAEDAMEMLSTYQPALILADIRLPGMNGLDMARKVKEDPRTSAIKVVALTADSAKEDQDRALRAGCEGYITKPVNTTTLASRVRELLERPAAGQASPAESADNDLALSFSGPEIETLRRNFLNVGAERSRQLADSLNTAFDGARAASQLHVWTGSAALLGYREISGLSRHAEELLREEPIDLSRLRDVLTDLFLTFSELHDRKALPLPKGVVKATTGKRVALIGFPTERADFMCALLERVKARPLLFDATDAPDSEAVRCCDLAIFHVRPETLESSWLQPSLPVPNPNQLVFAGDRRDLIGLSPDVRSRAVDVIVDPGEPEELLMRIAFAVTRRTAAVSGNPAPAAAAASVPARPRMAATPTVILADDDGIVLTLVGSTLQNYGMSCRTVDNGLDALNWIRSERPHVAVLDIQMPQMDGYEMLAAIRAENLPSRVILLSACRKEKEILRAFDLGADDYLVKPFNPFELVARVKRLLR